MYILAKLFYRSVMNLFKSNLSCRGGLNFATLCSMKKSILFVLLFLAALGAQAATVDATASYIYSSDYNQVRAGASIPLGVNAAVGLQGRYIEDKFTGGLQDPVYSLYLPVLLDLDLVKLTLNPFYYVKNKSDNATFQEASAFGINTQFLMNLREDEIAELYTQAYVGISYARQKGTLFEENAAPDNTYYTQMAYTLGLRQNFYNAFTFQTAATAYQYPDGVSTVEGFHGVMDQNDLAFTQSFDVSRELGKYALSARMTRVWVDQRSSLYVGYHYAEFHTADPQHSVLLGNSFYVAPQAQLDMAYNHLQTTGGKNKRDIFYIRLNMAF